MAAYEPDDRPFIERFFGTVATQFTHRLPGTTGSSAGDVLRKLRDPGGDLRLVVSLDELRELLSVWVWNYNGTPHGGLGSGRTPLEAMSAAIRGRGMMLRHVPLTLREKLCLLQNVHMAHVRGNITRGEKAHISFYHVRYTSHRLVQAPDLIGGKLRIYYDADDLRVLRAFLPDGTEFGELQAGGLWSATPHSLDTRKRIFRAKRLRQVSFDQTQDRVQVYLQYKRGQSKRSRRAASEIIVNASLSDEEIAAVLNYVMDRWGGKALGTGFVRFTPAESAARRAVKISDVVLFRRQIAERLRGKGIHTANYPWP